MVTCQLKNMGKYTGACVMSAASAGWICLTSAWTESPFRLAAYALLNVLVGLGMGHWYDRVHAAALRDDLTKAYNRRFLTRLLPGVMAKTSRRKSTLSISIIDCDHFKKINDQYGHALGDKVLQGVSRLLIRNTRKDDYVVRMGGDEFLVIAQNANLARSRSMTDRLEQELQNLSAELNLPLSVSTGTAVYPADGARLEDLLRIADMRMYESKMMKKSSAAPPAAAV